MKDFRIAIILCMTLTLLCGALYPMAVVGIAELLFPHKAHGSLVTDTEGETRGSELIGQSFRGAQWFWPRPSATPTLPYNPLSSGGSNMGAASTAYLTQATDRLDAFLRGSMLLPAAAPTPNASHTPATAATGNAANNNKTKAKKPAPAPATPKTLLPIPSEMIQASGSGLDPHISPQAARLQIARVAAVRHLEPSVLEALVERCTEPRTWGFLGVPRVNVLRLNLALEGIAQ